MPTLEQQLLSMFDKFTPSFLLQAGEQIKEKVVKKYIQESFYNQYDPQYYDRTYQLLDSVTCSKVNKIGVGQYQIEVYLNTDGVNYYDYNHNSVDPEDVFENAMMGYHGWHIQTEGRFMEEAKEDVQNGTTYDIFADFKKYLKGNGKITVK